MSDDRVMYDSLNGSGRKIAIVAGLFNDHIVGKLRAGAQAKLTEHGVASADISVFHVPGCFELPIAAQKLARSGKFDAVIALGAVIRGGTPHFDYVCNACTDGLTRVALDESLPVVFGVLTTDDLAQAEARAGGEHGNKGEDCAETALATLAMLDSVDAL
ncbi:MAG: 6,7-dimethyl-8-ribityllumazine synthase [Pseudomonadaceae bacterium]|nr:6,7-dimethyl-8-ribityllumazine synthase [Pseudomonadaceae bacterium]